MGNGWTWFRMAPLLALLAICPPGRALAGHDPVPDPPPRAVEAELPDDLNLDQSAVTVSGLSSGGFFAHQFHVAFSELVSGAGIIAGGPYACVETIPNPWWPFVPLDRFSAAVVECTHYWGDRFWGLDPSPPTVMRTVELIRRAQARGSIDRPSNLRDDRVWLFRGSKDEIVPETTAEALEGLYRHYGVREPRLEVHPINPDRPANHGLPVRDFPDDSRFPPRACGEHEPPYLIDCDLSAPELLLRHLYPEGFSNDPADAHSAGTLMEFDQRAFFDSADPHISLAGVGYVYVPSACRTQPCRLHVAFHGCRQTLQLIHDDFVRDAGYNGWAAANRIVVLYPQAAESEVNPNGCWDFWGYTGDHYAGRTGAQMQAVRAMVDRLLGQAD